jgi:hypothetical protein
MFISINPSISLNPSLILDHHNTPTLHMHTNRGKFTVPLSVGHRTLSLHRHRIHRLRKRLILSNNPNSNLNSNLNNNFIHNSNNHNHNHNYNPNNLLSFHPEYMPNSHSHSCSRNLSNNLKVLVRLTSLIRMQHIQIQTLKRGRNTMRRVGRILPGRCTLFQCQASVIHCHRQSKPSNRTNHHRIRTKLRLINHLHTRKPCANRRPLNPQRT